MDSALWSLESVSLASRLTGISLHVPRGTTAILGSSGAGKTSLLNLLVGFEQPDTGTIETRIQPSPGKLPLYWAPANSGLWPHLTVSRHLQDVAPEGRAAIDTPRLLAEFDLTHRAAARPAELSLGEKSRLSVARALAADPAVLVMDEPLGGVGQTQALAGWHTIHRHIQASGASLVFATHNPATVIAEADHVICLRDGSLIYQGTVSALYNSPPSREAAECLGFANWFEPSDAATWLGLTVGAPFCVRPHRLVLEADDTSPVLVESRKSMGAELLLDLMHSPTGAVRRFICRGDTADATAGTRLRLRRLETGDQRQE